MILNMYSKAMGILLMFFYVLVMATSTSSSDTNTETEASSDKESRTTDSLEVTTSKDKLILFFGNSLTAGMGLDANDAFPAVIQRKIDSLDLPYHVVNAGLSGETTASGKNRLEWVMNQKADVFVLELGANDGLRGVPLSETRNNLQAIIDFVK